jgi:RNA polymerase sigma-70 factor (ECF subfamily)
MTSSADRLSERVVVLRCQAGDDAAFEELVGIYSQRLRYYLRKMLREADRAEDALQDVWLQVLRGLSRLADPGAFPTWLYRIARDRAYGELRKARHNLRPLEEADLIDEGGGDIRLDDAERVHIALDELAPEHREVLVLRFLEDMTYENIAQVTGCPVGTVRSRIHYAKRALRCALERRGGHDG